MKKYLAILVCALLLAAPATAQQKRMVTELPDISVIGNFLYTSSDEGQDFDVKELEFSFQSYLYPSVKADIFAALHKEANGERVFELEEAYVTFSDVWGVLTQQETQLGLGAIAGKKLLNVGKINPLHPEQYAFVDRPIAVQQLIGGEEGLAGEGVAAQYLLPVPFFSQIEVGMWEADSHADHEEHEEESHEDGHEMHGPDYENQILNARLWNGFALSDNQELEIGVSYVRGNATASSASDQTSLVGFDLTHHTELSDTQRLTLQAEWLQAEYGEEGESAETQTGGYLSGYFKANPLYQLGVRYGFLGQHGDEGEDLSQWSLLVTRQLTETSKFRIQYNTGEEVEDTILAQFIFGMGPHSHVLQ